MRSFRVDVRPRTAEFVASRTIEGGKRSIIYKLCTARLERKFTMRISIDPPMTSRIFDLMDRGEINS